MLKKLFFKYGHLIISFAIIVATYGSERICYSILHDPKKPKS